MKKIGLFVVASILGFVLFKMNIPIPYLIAGVIVAAGSKAFLDPATNWNKNWREVALCIAGYGIGCNFTLTTWGKITEQFVGVVGSSLIAIGLSIVIAWWTSKYSFANFLSCVMGISPGGLTQMMLMSEEDERADANVVLVMQTLRLFSVILVVPLLVVTFLNAHVVPIDEVIGLDKGEHWLWMIPLGVVGAGIFTYLKLPTPRLMGPILLTAIVSCVWGPLQKPPYLLLAIAQVNIGLFMGTLLDAEKLKKTKALIPFVFVGSAIMIGSSVVVAYYLSAYYGFSLITAFLAMAPGGIAEMCLAGLSMGEDVSIILT